jgi:hypothetical protein
MCKKVNDFLNSNNILAEEQFGFRKISQQKKLYLVSLMKSYVPLI